MPTDKKEREELILRRKGRPVLRFYLEDRHAKGGKAPSVEDLYAGSWNRGLGTEAEAEIVDETGAGMREKADRIGLDKGN
jgi:hypothetical protein